MQQRVVLSGAMGCLSKRRWAGQSQTVMYVFEHGIAMLTSH